MTMNDARMETAALEQRFAELETRLAFQEHALIELSDALAASRMEATRTGDRLQHVLEELNRSRDGFQADPADEPPPPHY